jgi:hypothetical protein
MPEPNENLAKPGTPPVPKRTHKKKRSQAEIKRALTQAAGIYTDAAEILQVNRNTVAEYVKRDPELQAYLEQVEAAHDDIAEGNIKSALRARDIATSKWWLERRRRDKYSTRTEHTGPDGGPIEHMIAEGEITQFQMTLLSDDQLRTLIEAGRIADELESQSHPAPPAESGMGATQAGM